MSTYQLLHAESERLRLEYEACRAATAQAMQAWHVASQAAMMAFNQENDDFLNSSFFTGPEARLLNQRLA